MCIAANEQRSKTEHQDQQAEAAQITRGGACAGGAQKLCEPAHLGRPAPANQGRWLMAQHAPGAALELVHWHWQQAQPRALTLHARLVRPSCTSTRS